MRRTILSAILALGVTPAAYAQGALTLEQFLEQVKRSNPEARAAVLNVEASTLKLREADANLVPELYASYDRFDRRLEQNSTFAPEKVLGDQWRAGVKKQWSFGLQSDLYFNTIRMDQTLPSGPVRPFRFDNAQESTVNLELAQPLWRNGFGESVRANNDANLARIKAENMKARWALKALLVKAEDTYWNLVSQNQIIKLQEENVERSGKMRDLMRRKFGQRLVDDVESLQALAAHETREIELLNSRDERASVARAFNTLRGIPSDTVAETLAPFPEKELSKKFSEKAGVTREDFLGMIEEAKSMEMKARASKSDVRPKLDLVAAVGSNGVDGKTAEAHSEAWDNDHPFWSVGLRFSVAVDIGRIHAIKRGYEASRQAARHQQANAEFTFERTYRDLLDKYDQAQKRFAKAQSLESTQTDLVKRERARLMNGRTTTFQAMTQEQNLAAAQIQRVKTQQALVQLYNVLKTFEVQQ